MAFPRTMANLGFNFMFKSLHFVIYSYLHNDIESEKKRTKASK